MNPRLTRLVATEEEGSPGFIHQCGNLHKLLHEAHEIAAEIVGARTTEPESSGEAITLADTLGAAIDSALYLTQDLIGQLRTIRGHF